MPGRPARFRAPHEKPRALNERDYELRRGTAASRGYDARWARASAGNLRAHPLCLGCLALGRTVAASLTDHVLPAAAFPASFWEPGNWQSSCTWHHSAVKQQLEAMFAAGTIGADALRLDSAAAVALARELLGR